MQNKIWVECVTGKEKYPDQLTVGKAYHAEQSGDRYWLVNDLGSHTWYYTNKFKVIPPPVTEEKWVVANENTKGFTSITWGQKYLVVREQSGRYVIVDNSGLEFAYEPTFLTPCSPPTKGESELKSNEEKPLSDEVKKHDFITDFLDGMRMNAKLNPDLKSITMEFPTYTLTYDVREDVVVIAGK